MKFDKKISLMLIKKWLDQGRGLTSYFNEIILIFGVWSITEKKSPMLTFAIASVYGLVCVLSGWLWFKFGWKRAEMEVENIYNPFVTDVRENLIKKKI